MRSETVIPSSTPLICRSPKKMPWESERTLLVYVGRRPACRQSNLRGPSVFCDRSRLSKESKLIPLGGQAKNDPGRHRLDECEITHRLPVHVDESLPSHPLPLTFGQKRSYTQVACRLKPQAPRLTYSRALWTF